MHVVIQYTKTIKIYMADIANHLRRIEVEPKGVIAAIIEFY